MNNPYGSWSSPLTATELTRGVKGFADLHTAAGQLLLLESRPEENGRTTLVMLDPAAPEKAGTELSPAPFNVRSRVHEYGGGAVLATHNAVFFVNFSDQNIYQVTLEHTSDGVQPSPPTQLTQGDAQRRYADLALDATNSQLVAVCEQHSDATQEPANLLVAIDLASGQQRSLHEGHDFYASPRVNPVGTTLNTLAFVAWDHPNMPWDATVLCSGQLAQGTLSDVTVLAGGGTDAKQSIAQPDWRSAAELAFVSDRNGFWNHHLYAAGSSRCVYADDAEYASPAWVFGQREHLQLESGDIAVVRQHDGKGELFLLSADGKQARTLHSEYAGYHALCAIGSKLYCIADRTTGFAVLTAIDLANGAAQVLRTAGELGLPHVAEPEALSITNRSGLTTHAWLYLPINQTTGERTGATRTERPPLLVLSHGGPTSSCSPALNPRIQYYTSRGWAVADVNYGGSTGYGRAYRQRLRDNWGVLDVHDCEDVAQALASTNRVDIARMAIKGGSAGGYTTLAALTFGDVFSAGASHYGIGDLTALAAETHKFEARYVDGLVPADAWQSRSPINSVDSLSCPVIFFQGSDDAVVPPNQAQAMVTALSDKGLPVAYVEFAGEGHGFRQAKNIQHAAAAEYQFFCTVFNIRCPDAAVDLTIENLA